MPRARETTWIAVADGAKALIAENTGTDRAPALTVIEERAQSTPPTRALGTDKPGRMPDSGPGQRSAMADTDLHEDAERGFLRALAEHLNGAAGAGGFDRLMIVAPPRALGHLRAALSAEAGRRVVREIGKDLVHHPVAEIERQIAESSWG